MTEIESSFEGRGRKAPPLLFVFSQGYASQSLYTASIIGRTRFAYCAKGIIAVAQAPVVHQPPLQHGVGLDDLVDRRSRRSSPSLLAFLQDFPQQLIVGAVLVEEVAVAPGDELGRERDEPADPQRWNSLSSNNS